MADTLTGLIPDIYEAMDVVSREKIGLAQSVTVESTGERVAKGQDVVTSIAPEIALRDITAAMSPTAASDLTEGTATINMAYSKAAPFNLSGLTTRTLNTSIGIENTRAGRIAQALRILDNTIEGHIAALHTKFSRAYGTAGTTPFASTLADTAQLGKILDDNGAPQADRSFVFDTAAGANLRTLTQLTNVNQAGTDATLRRGELLNVNDFSLKESGQIATSTAGTMSGGKTGAAGYAIGATTLAFQDATGTGVMVDGDVFTIAGDTNKYVVTTATFAGANPATGDTIVIAEPGLRKAVPAANTAITVVAAAARNMAFSKNAIGLITSMPELPEEGDMASDILPVTSPISGITYEFAVYKGFRQNLYQIGLNWGTDVVKPEHTAIGLG